MSRIFSIQLLMSVILYAPKMVLISFQFYMSDCTFAMPWAPITLFRYDLEQFCILIFRECVCSQFLRAREQRNRPRFGWVSSWRLGMFFTRYTLSLVQTCKPGELVAAQRFLGLPLCVSSDYLNLSCTQNIRVRFDFLFLLVSFHCDKFCKLVAQMICNSVEFQIGRCICYFFI